MLKLECRKRLKEGNLQDFGIVGKPTQLKDSNKNELFVGDIVGFYAKNIHFVSFVVSENDNDFIMGIEVDSYTPDFNGWEVHKVCDHSHLSKGFTLYDSSIIVTEEESETILVPMSPAPKPVSFDKKCPTDFTKTINGLCANYDYNLCSCPCHGCDDFKAKREDLSSCKKDMPYAILEVLGLSLNEEFELPDMRYNPYRFTLSIKDTLNIKDCHGRMIADAEVYRVIFGVNPIKKLKSKQTRYGLIQKQSNYQVGDRVLIKKKWSKGIYPDKEMDKYLDTVATINFVFENDVLGESNTYRIKEDDGHWVWYPRYIKGKIL